MTPSPIAVSAATARRMALAAQGFADPRPPGRVDRRHLRRVFERVGVIQIDSVNVLVRSQELPLFSRLGPYPRSLLPDALDDGELFEYWAHVASIIPTEHRHLFGWRMAIEHDWKQVEALRLRRPEFVDHVFDYVDRHGPIVAGELQQQVGPKGTWWDWDDGKLALEYLFDKGRVAVRRRRSDFARMYDLPERILPASALARPVPPAADARKELLVLAARSLGVATFEELTDYYRLRNPACRPLVAELVEEGRLIPAAVEGWPRQAFLHPDARAPRRITTRALLSPFDSLVWHRERTERLFGFRYRLEIYTPAPKRVFGYYVLPFLLGDEIVARVDLKAERAAGVLSVLGVYGEPGILEPEVAEELAAELESMAGWLGLDAVVVSPRGDLAPELARTMLGRRAST